ncbi:type IV pilus assembly protein PilY1 [Geobacter metallireducens GS-15]|uniref:Type IV pilus assembly protein PilY1 n=1 Tax=Geobacter metallireducens (strain ATCC 53774 / DSM 7210 / GS-15) TaxID=269799 RepID=Q39X15_GEOMG|nr:PilC/PilY family type IV pilus protein [Geobacter metallireducens]ABB31209.1 type IV pilus assembly protein PilY1 [Geobacter metallireducens GS-15]
MLTSRLFKKIMRMLSVPVTIAHLAAAPGIARADDTEIYSAGATMKPMVMIIMDNSGSMGDPVPYDNATAYAGTYTKDTVYQYTCTARNKKGQCTATQWQVYTGVFTDQINRDGGVDVAGQDGIDDSSTALKTGNRLNYEALPTTSKLSTAKGVLNNLVDLMYNDVDFGFMKFNTEDGGNIISKIGATITAMHGQISAINATTWTPLAEALTDAGKYFEDTYTGQYSPWNSNNWCQKAFIIIVTDGEPTHDTDTTIIGHFLDRGQTGITDANRGQKWDQDGDYNMHSTTTTDPLNNDVWVADDTYSDTVPQTFLDDVAKYLYTHDLRPDLQGTQNVTTYTIGYAHDSPLLQRTAQNGGGLYFTANNAAELEHSLLMALDDIAKKLQTYTAPVVPITRTSSGDKMYLAFFKPLAYSKFWVGDLHKYGLSSSNQIIDSAGNQATDSSGAMLDTAVPYWSVSSLLKSRSTARNIYTYLGTNSNLTDSSNAFTIANTALTAAVLGNPAKSNAANAATAARDDLINYIHGQDAYDDNGNLNWTEKRDFILGDILHSVPLVVDYNGPTATDPNRHIFFGSNDGMLHCINDANGSEEWGFVPPDALPRLKLFEEGSSHPYFVDGSVKLYQLRNSAGVITKAIIIFGQRAGGDNYYALDVTNPASPQFLWRINGSSTGFSEIGQTWSEPLIAKVKKNDSNGVPVTYDAVIFGAGFDSAQANTKAVAAAAKGRGVFIANLLTGELISSFKYTTSNGMNYAIPSNVAAVDMDSNGIVDRIYVGDLGGNLWRIGKSPNSTDPTDAQKDINLIDNWGIRKLFASNPGADGSSGRKIFYQPEIALQSGHNYVYFSTGDRDNPRSTDAVDRLYGVKDTSPDQSVFATLTENSLTNQTGVVSSSILPLTTSGWYVRLIAAAGEKSLAAPVLFNKYVLFDTFLPNNALCDIGGGAKVYAVSYLNGLYSRYSLGNGIPTEAVLVVRPTGTTAFVGAGGGVINLLNLIPDSPPTGGGGGGGDGSANQKPIQEIFNFVTGIIPISWREVF